MIFEMLTEWLMDLMRNLIVTEFHLMLDFIRYWTGVTGEQLSQTPSSFSPEVFNLLRNISETVILPIAGIVLTYVACYELIHIVLDQNNFHSMGLLALGRWLFKTSIAVFLLSNVFTIVSAVFDLGAWIVRQTSGVMLMNITWTEDIEAGLRSTLEEYNFIQLIGLMITTIIVALLVNILAVFAYVIVMVRLVEIYITTSIAPIPFATFASKEQSQMGQNYLRSLFALAFQGFLIMVCFAVYGGLVMQALRSNNLFTMQWILLATELILCIALVKTGSLSKSIFNAR